MGDGKKIYIFSESVSGNNRITYYCWNWPKHYTLHYRRLKTFLQAFRRKCLKKRGRNACRASPVLFHLNLAAQHGKISNDQISLPCLLLSYVICDNGLDSRQHKYQPHLSDWKAHLQKFSVEHKKIINPDTSAKQSSSKKRFKKPFDPKARAIKFKAFRYIFTPRDVRKGLDEKSFIKKLKKSRDLEGRYHHYVDMMEGDDGKKTRLLPWRNPFNKVLFLTAYWTPIILKWIFVTFIVLFVINYIPGPTQHTVELIFARSIYDTAPVKRLPESLETYAHSAKIVDAYGETIKSYGKRHVTYHIPEKAQKALLACEDHFLLPHPNNPWYVNAFLIHPGVSWFNLVGAAKETIMGNTRGASTIVMQNAKKILGNKERTIRNKLEEIIISYMMVAKFGKEKNLIFYLNTVPVGANIYGFPAAANNYFKKDLSELNTQQLVTIASFIPNHNRQVAFYEIINGKQISELDKTMQSHAKGAINKINLALTFLRDRDEISEREYRKWLLTNEESIRRIGFRDFRSPLYGEEEWTSWNVIKEVTARNYIVGDREITGAQLVLDEKGDVVIETGVDTVLVDKIKEIIPDFLKSKQFKEVLRERNQHTWEKDLELYQKRKIMPPYHDFNDFMDYLYRNINVGVIIINQEGEIIAYIGGKEFLQGSGDEPENTTPAEQDGESGKKIIIDLMNKKAKIMPSSTIKPIIAYYAMLTGNARLDSTFEDKPLEYKYVESAGKRIWLPRNWYGYDAKGKGNNRYLGRKYSLLEAQVLSVNTIFARTYTNRQIKNAMLVGFDEIGLDYNKEDAKYWPFGIGASDVPVQQWLGVYNAFLDGQYREPAFVKQILINGEVIYARKTDPSKQPIPLFDAKKEREDEMRVLYEVCNRGTGANMKSEFKHHKNLVSGKTGTATEGRSAVFISHFNPYQDRAKYADHNMTMIVAVTTNTGGFKNVGTSANGPAKITGQIYNHLFHKKLQAMMDEKIEAAKRDNAHFRNNHVYWANVNRYMDHLLNKKCGKDYIYKNVIGVDAYQEALEQILNSNNKIYTGQDTIFSQLVQYYCDQEKVVKMKTVGAVPHLQPEKQTPN